MGKYKEGLITILWHILKWLFPFSWLQKDIQKEFDNHLHTYYGGRKAFYTKYHTNNFYFHVQGKNIGLSAEIKRNTTLRNKDFICGSVSSSNAVLMHAFSYTSPWKGLIWLILVENKIFSLRMKHPPTHTKVETLEPFPL